MKKRLLSLFLVFTLLVSSFPVGVFAAGEKQDEITSELNVKTVKMDGKSYVEIPIGKINDGVHFRKIDDKTTTPTKNGSGQKINAAAAIVWQMFDWDFPAEGFKAELKIGNDADPRTNETIAEIQVKGTVPIPERVGENNFQFITTDKYQVGDEKKDLKLVFDNSFRANCRISAGYDSDPITNGYCYYIVVTQITMPAYTAEWYDNGNETTRPTIKGVLYSAGKKEAEVDVKKENLKYGTIGPKSPRFVDENDINGQNIGMVDFVPTGNITEAQLTMTPGQNPIATGKFVSYQGSKGEVQLKNTADDKIEAVSRKYYDNVKDQLIEVKSPAYFYQLIGDNNHMWRFQMRQVLNVKLNSGAGKVGEEKGKDLKVGGKEFQEIGHSEYIYNNDVELNDYIRKLYPKKAGETDEQLKKRVSEATQSQRVIDFNTDETVTPPKVKVDGTEVDALFKGWATKPQTINEKGELSAIEGKLVDEKGNLTPAGKTFKFTEKETTLYRVYEPKGVGKVNFAYVDAAGSSIEAKYKFISNQDGKDVDDKGAKLTLETKYPLDKTSAEGDVIEAALASTAKAPSFIGYKVTGVEIKEGDATAPAGATYTKDGKYTITYKYEKLPEIIPEKGDDGQPNPKVTEDVKETYTKVVINADNGQNHRGKLYVGDTEPADDKKVDQLVYYVNPKSGKTLANVLSENKVNVKANENYEVKKAGQDISWTFGLRAGKDEASLAPVEDHSISDTSQVVTNQMDNDGNDLVTEMILTANYVVDQGTVTYEYAYDKGTADPAPAEPTNVPAITPDNKKYDVGTEVKAQNTATKDQTIPVKDATDSYTIGNWVFQGWKDTKGVEGKTTIVKGENKFIGTWKYVPVTEQTVTIKFVDENGKALPSASGELNKFPKVTEDNKKYYLGQETEVPNTPAVGTEVKGTKDGKYGTWTFDGWYAKSLDAANKNKKLTIGEDNNQYLGKWTFKEAGKKNVEFSFVYFKKKAGGELEYIDKLAIDKFKALQPLNLMNQPVGSDINLPQVKSPIKIEKGEKQGTWTFDGWYKSTDTTYQNKLTSIQVSETDAENKLVGRWVLEEAKTANVSYKFAIGANTLGDNNLLPASHKLPSGVMEQLKSVPTNGQYIGNKISPIKSASKFAAVPEEIDKKIGNWTLDHWDPKELVIQEDESKNVFTGMWKWEQEVSEKPTVNKVKPGDKTITGTGKSESKILVELPDGTKVPGKVDEKGNWTVDVPKDKKLKDGDKIKVTQEEKGKKPSDKVEVTVTKEDKPVEPKPEEPKNYDGYINLEPVGETKPDHATDIHAIYLYGYQDKTVHPQGDMTRAEAAAMVARLKNLDMSDTSKPDFKDVESRWYNSAINAVVKAGLMKGYPDGTFAPNGKITRAEFAQLIKGIDNPNMAELPFTDVAGHWGLDAISQAYANKRIMGYPDNTFKPNNDITRAEAVTILNSLFDRGINEAGLANVRKDIVEFKDLDRSHWAYYQIVEASNTHEFYRAKDGEVPEVWVRVLKTWNDFLK